MNDRFDDELQSRFERAAAAVRIHDVPPERAIARARRARRRRQMIAGASCSLVIALAVVATAVALAGGPRTRGRGERTITDAATAPTPDTATAASTAAAPTTGSAPDGTFPPADPSAQNFLIIGADNNSCVDPNSPYAPAFGDRSSMGERSDTIMVMRVDPSTRRAAILSIPRDLWVTIVPRGAKGRINSAYVRDDPTQLIETIALNFGIPIDHYIQIDFCAFKTIVDSIDGGVGVPFLFPARDTHTGLYVPAPGCYYFDGDSALAYVRSRYYQYYDENTGEWVFDPGSDLSRIARQQDFLRRVLESVTRDDLLDPKRISALLRAAQDHIVVDDGMTISKELELVGLLRDIEPGDIAGYRIETTAANIAGNSVLLPHLDTADMQHIISVFRNDAALVGAPDTPPDTIQQVPAAAAPGDPNTQPTRPDTITVDSTPPASTQQTTGIIPPRDQTCS